LQSGEEQKEDSTMKAAGKISEEIGRPGSREERKKAGPWVHYAFGTLVGAFSGVATEMELALVREINPVIVGSAYGTAVFLSAHEVAVPALKISSNPLKEPIHSDASMNLPFRKTRVPAPSKAAAHAVTVGEDAILTLKI
jgi:hypothetical protein